MTIRYRCPISTCQWFHETVATDSASNYPPDVLHWTLANWADIPERAGSRLAAVHVIDAHPVTHSPVEWMTELRCLQRRAEDAEAALDRILDTLEKTADCAAGMHPVTSMRLPSREQIAAIQTARIGVANEGGAATDGAEYATGGFIPGPKPDDPPPYRVIDPCTHGRLIDAWRHPQDPSWTVTTDPNGTVHLTTSRGKQYEEDVDA